MREFSADLPNNLYCNGSYEEDGGVYHLHVKYDALYNQIGEKAIDVANSVTDLLVQEIQRRGGVIDIDYGYVTELRRKKKNPPYQQIRNSYLMMGKEPPPEEEESKQFEQKVSYFNKVLEMLDEYKAAPNVISAREVAQEGLEYFSSKLKEAGGDPEAIKNDFALNQNIQIDEPGFFATNYASSNEEEMDTYFRGAVQNDEQSIADFEKLVRYAAGTISSKEDQSAAHAKSGIKSARMEAISKGLEKFSGKEISEDNIPEITQVIYRSLVQESRDRKKGHRE